MLAGIDMYMMSLGDGNGGRRQSVALRPFTCRMVLSKYQDHRGDRQKDRYSMIYISTLYMSLVNTYGTMAKAALQAEWLETPSDLKPEYRETIIAKVAPPLFRVRVQ